MLYMMGCCFLAQLRFGSRRGEFSARIVGLDINKTCPSVNNIIPQRCSMNRAQKQVNDMDMFPRFLAKVMIYTYLNSLKP